MFPKEDARDHEALRQFVAAVRTVALNASGTPVNMQEAGRLISWAFMEAALFPSSRLSCCLQLYCGGYGT